MDSIFGIGFLELVVILIIAGIVMGPERIGHAARWLGKMTVQLQTISRGFMRQLTAELDAAEKGEIKEAMQEIQDLQRQLRELRNEFTAVANSAVRDGQQAANEIQNSIQPPTLGARPTDDQDGAVTPQNPPDLPNPIDVSDDPE